MFVFVACLALTVRVAVVMGADPVVPCGITVASADDPPSLHVLAASLVQSQTKWQRRLLSGYGRAGCYASAAFGILIPITKTPRGCPSLSRHSSAVRLLLLLAGDIESNPGPIDLEQYSDDTLSSALFWLNFANEADCPAVEEAAQVPVLRHDIISALKEGYSEDVVRFAINIQPVCDIGHVPPGNSTNAMDTDTDTRVIDEQRQKQQKRSRSASLTSDVPDGSSTRNVRVLHSYVRFL